MPRSGPSVHSTAKPWTADQQVPGVEAAMQDAFIDGLAAACTMIGALCLLAALAAAVALPGHRYDPTTEGELVDVDA
jgi:hypothetical protein